MAQRLVELCSILIENAYGELASQIFTSLAHYGRSSLTTLSQITRAPASRLKTGLALLIQHHIVLYHTPEEESSNLPTFYQVDLNAAYNLLRAHKYVNIISEREGEAAGRLVTNIIELGHANVGDLEQAYDLTPALKRDSGIDIVDQHMTDESMVNGIAKDGGHIIPSDEITTTSKFHSTLRKLLDQGYLVKVTERSYIPRADYEDQARKAVIDDNDKFAGGKITGSKKSQEFSAAVNSIKRKWEDEDSYSKSRHSASKGSIKRPSDSSGPSKKRVKTNGDLPNGIHHEFIDDDRDAEECVSRLPSNMFVRANFDKCTLLLRNLRLEQMAHYYLGPATGAVFGALLRSLEGTTKSQVKPDPCKAAEDDSDDEEEDIIPSASDVEVLDHLNKAIDLGATVKVPKSASNLPNGVGKNHGKPKVLSEDPDEAELGIKVEKDSDDEEEEDKGTPVGVYNSLKERNKRLALVRMHLAILAEHPKRFLKRSYDSRASRVDIAALTHKLVQAEVDTMIGSRYSHLETRIIRLLREKGKLEEKSIQTMTMLRVGPLRMHLTFLQFAGICDSQELPKDATRQPNRMLHLWQFDEKRVVNQYLHRSYQGMSRAMQRLQVEREGKFKAVIEKAERADVRGREQELLNFQEKQLLKEWREIEERILVQVDRLDDLVGVLRDFPGHGHSLNI